MTKDQPVECILQRFLYPHSGRYNPLLEGLMLKVLQPRPVYMAGALL